MPFNLDEWLKELNADGSLSDEELKQLQATLSKGTVPKRLEEKTLRQAEFSRKMNELGEAEKRTVALQQELAKWKQGAEAQLNQMNLTASQERHAREQIEAKAKVIAETYGLDLAELGIAATPPGTTSPPPNSPAPGTSPPNPPKPAPSKLDDMEQAINALPFLSVELLELAREHQQLFGQPLDKMRELVQKALQDRKPLRTTWEEAHKVPERRQTLQEEQIQGRIKAAVEKRETELRSELQLPPTPRPEARSPVLTEFKPPSTDQKPPEVRISAVDRAVAAFAEHKHAQPTP